MRRTLNASGTLTSQQRYLPFGQVRDNIPAPNGLPTTDLGYTGQRDLGMGLMDYHARFYSPSLGRFAQPDSIIPNAGNPQSWNRYSYVMNSPILYNDPTGHMCSDPENTENAFCEGSSAQKTKIGDKMVSGNGRRDGLGFCGGWGQKKCRRINGGGGDLALMNGLGLNSCTNNTCTGLPSNVSSPESSNSYLCLAHTACQYNSHFGNYTYDLGVMYWSGEVNASNTFPGPNGSIITLSNDGGESDHFGFDINNGTFEVKSTTMGLGLGNGNYVNYTPGSGFSAKQLAINMTLDVDYSIKVNNQYSFTGNFHSELGVRPIIPALVFAAYLIAVRLPRVDPGMFRVPPIPG
ncbi:MAG: RHS repeat-associated core domain-containing protein [Chloroflexi bacterium]|nr:RHS repeat-associated core domain-containing protein [Chloroflexota bacterium]